MTGPMPRLFIAAWACEGVRARAREAEAFLRAHAQPLRFAEVQRLHATLAFLGMVDPEGLPAIERICRDAAAASSPFDVEVDQLGAFPNERKATVIWLGSRGEQATFRALAQGLRTRLASAGFRLDEKDAVPHVTIARAKAPVELPAVEIAATPWRIDAIAMVESRTLPSGPVYTTLRTWELGA